MASGETINQDNPEDTLIVFDEIQECPNALNTLKYFCENTPHYHVACAGSLLGIALSKPASFPVGKVDFLEIRPMTFTEFLLANGDTNLVNYMDTLDRLEPIPEAFFNPLYEKLKMYFITGGMPDIFPIEVKSAIDIESKSLKKFGEKYGDKVKLRVRFSLNNLRLDDDVLNIPLFMADYTDKIIGMALKQLDIK